MSEEGALPNILKKSFAAIAVIGVLLQLKLLYLGIQPVSINLVGGNADLPSLSPNNRLSGIVEKIGEDDLIGPESLVVTKHKQKDFIFAALGDGRIVRIDASAAAAADDDNHHLSWTTLIRTGQDHDNCGGGGPTDTVNMERVCGRPLGMALVKRSSIDFSIAKKDDEDVLVVLDPHGLLMIDNIYSHSSAPTKKHVLATHAKNEPNQPFSLLNAIVQAPDNSLYFTETSTVFQRRRIFYAAFDGTPKGRLLRYTPNDKLVSVMADNLYMPNGLTLSHDQQSLLFVSGVQLLQYDLQTRDITVFVHAMPGTGDNIKTFTHLPTETTTGGINKKTQKKCYWAALGSKCTQPFCLLHYGLNKPMLRAFLLSVLSYETIVNLIPKFSGFVVYGEDGTLLETYQDAMNNMTAPWLAEAEPLGEYIYLGSWYNSFLGRVKKQDLVASFAE